EAIAALKNSSTAPFASDSDGMKWSPCTCVDGIPADPPRKSGSLPLLNTNNRFSASRIVCASADADDQHSMTRTQTATRVTRMLPDPRERQSSSQLTQDESAALSLPTSSRGTGCGTTGLPLKFCARLVRRIRRQCRAPVAQLDRAAAF